MKAMLTSIEDGPRTQPRLVNRDRPQAATLPMLLTVDDAADLLRTTRRAIYAMVERCQLPGVIRIRRRVLLRADDLLHRLDQKRASSPKEGMAMSVKVRPYRRGGWEVDITVRLPNGSRWRERSKAPVSSKSAAVRWGEDRERHLLQHGVPQPKKEVPTLEQFAPRFLDGYARANRQKPSGVAAEEMSIRVHLTPSLGAKALNAIPNEDVQRLKHRLLQKAPKTVNNILTVLNVMLKQAVEWDVIERVTCTIKLLPVAKGSTRFYDFDEFERLVAAAQGMDPRAYLLVLMSGEAGLRLGEMVALEWNDIDFVKRQMCVQRSAWKGQVASPKSGRLRYIPLTTRLAAVLRDHRHLRGPLMLYQDDGSPLTEGLVQGFVRRAAQKAGLYNNGPHMLRHTFCSHLAMRGAPARAIQELAGHQDLTTTQRYMHLSPAALDSAIQLLDSPGIHGRRGDIGDGIG